LAYLKRKSYIKYKDRLIEGDSLYYDRNREYASATNNVKITDTINKGIIKGHYAEIYRNLKTEKDSVMITKRAVAITLVEKDSMYIHGKKMLITGKPGERIIRAFNNVRFYKTDMSGKCDSIHSNQKIALTKLIGRPILWNYENQMTGDIMHLIGNNKTEKLDSLKVLNNAFIISKDSLGTGYNQVKGQNLFGKFRDNKLYEVDVIKNTEVIYYMRNDQNELIGINKNVSSKINMTLDKNTIDSITFFNQVDGDIYPEKDLPENARKLRGFIWRGDERIKSKDDIFPEEENELDAKIQAESKADMKKKNLPLKPSKETLDYDKTLDSEVEKIDRVFFSGTIFNHIDEQYGVYRSRYIFKDLLYELDIYTSLSYEEYMKKMCMYKFSLDLLGVGDPNKRTFEILASGSLRIAQRNNLRWPCDMEFCEETLFSTAEEFYKKMKILKNNPEIYKKCLDRQEQIYKYFTKGWCRDYINTILEQGQSYILDIC
jgi:hypothetical protein